MTDASWLESARKQGEDLQITSVGQFARTDFLRIANRKGHMTDALVQGGDEGRDTLR